MSTENNAPEQDNVHSINFSNTDLSVDQIIEVRPGTNIDEVLTGLNSGELATTLNHGGDEEPWITDNEGTKVAKILEQSVQVTGVGFKDFNQPAE